jgi:transcriptional regulator with XRE-family HTH domain
MRAAHVECASWERFFVTTVREQILSEFIDAWNAGERPDVDDYIARVPAEERAELGEDLAAFLTFAPTPGYSDDALTAVRAEIEETVGARDGRSLFGALLTRLRERRGWSNADVAGELVINLGLDRQGTTKTAGYLERLEAGSLDPTRVSRRVFEALGRVFGVAGAELEGAADRSGWSVPRAASPAPVFRADEDAAERTSRHLEVLADALAAPGTSGRDEVDDLFLGGR